MQKFDLKIARAKAIRGKNFAVGKLSKVDSKIKGSEQDSTETIKTLAGVRQGDMKKVKNELKEMLPRLKPSEVKRFIIRSSQRYLSFCALLCLF